MNFKNKMLRGNTNIAEVPIPFKNMLRAKSTMIKKSKLQ